MIPPHLRIKVRSPYNVLPRGWISTPLQRLQTPLQYGTDITTLRLTLHLILPTCPSQALMFIPKTTPRHTPRLNLFLQKLRASPKIRPFRRPIFHQPGRQTKIYNATMQMRIKILRHRKRVRHRLRIELHFPVRGLGDKLEFEIGLLLRHTLS